MPRRFAKSDRVVERQVRGCRILVPLGDGESRIDSLYTLNEMASHVWDRAVQGASEEEIVAGIHAEHDTEIETVRRDVAALLAQLVEIGALSVVPAGASST